MPFKFNRLTLLVKIFSLQFTEISEYQPPMIMSYRASKSRFFPYNHCKFCSVCPTSKMTSVTVQPSIEKLTQDYGVKYNEISITLYGKATLLGKQLFHEYQQ